jgi:PIN domain nuclease of toxin-antitoxin system
LVVVDTHAWYWWVTGDRNLSAIARRRLNRDRDIVVPAICLLEMSNMALRGRVTLTVEIAQFLEEALAWDGVRLAPITPRIAVATSDLASAHSLDAMDALIAATATTLRVPLVTRDEKLQALPNLQVVW